ncbi:MAG TPA: hypothetical protein VEG44_04485 [Candidatus Acidoferrales bacterium]|nr:hypothetical protein [Candidatus Acidoferrales bacterium]
MRSTGERLTNIGRGGYRGLLFRFQGDGMDIPYNTLRAAKGHKVEKEN